VPNDRLHAWLRAEADHASASAAAADVNARVTRVLAKLKTLPDAQVSTSGYTSQQIVEKGKPSRWRVVQTIKVEGGDFAATGDAIARVQAEDGVLLSGISFGVSDELRRRTQDAITQQAIAAWRTRAQNAAQGFGSTGWRAGRVSVQANDGGRPYPMMARAEMQMAAAPPPIPLEAGSTEVTVTVSGEAILDPARPR
jgi:predicted secreted protein